MVGRIEAIRERFYAISVDRKAQTSRRPRDLGFRPAEAVRMTLPRVGGRAHAKVGNARKADCDFLKPDSWLWFDAAVDDLHGSSPFLQ